MPNQQIRLENVYFIVELHTSCQIPAGWCRDTYFNALAHLMRLRQACCHPALVRRAGSSGKKPAPEEVAAARALPQAMKVALLEVLLGADAVARSRCAACEDVADDPVAAHCGHVLCRCAPPSLALRQCRLCGCAVLAAPGACLRCVIPVIGSCQGARSVCLGRLNRA